MPTEDLLLVTSKVDSLRASDLLHKGGRGSFLEGRSARGVHGRHKGPLLHAGGGRLPQCEAQGSVCTLRSHGHGLQVWGGVWGSECCVC